MVPSTANSQGEGLGLASASLVMATTNPLPTQEEPSLSYTATSASVLPLLPGGSVPEFLYQLTKMLTDPANRPIIEWTAHTGVGRIEVHRPDRLEKEVLGRYFRHSRYASFQRQLNYFGFRKNAGKGKMSPCSYVNAGATTDLRSLLTMKRKNAGRERGRVRENENQEREKQPQQAKTLAAEVAAGGSSAVSGIKRSSVAAALPSATGNLGDNEALRLNAIAATIARNMSSSSTTTAGEIP